MTRILIVEIRQEPDVVLARQRAREIARQLGFGAQDQVQIATAVSEIVRNALQYAGGGKTEFHIVNGPDGRLRFQIAVIDFGPGIADLDRILRGQYQSRTGLGRGISGGKSLVDRLDVQTVVGQGTTVRIEQDLPVGKTLADLRLSELTKSLALTQRSDAYAELQRQNQELVETLSELRAGRTELEALNRELEETNRGVVALYAELDDKATSLRQASDLKSKFLSQMSHEFRTPLNSIVGLSQLLLNLTDGDLTEEQVRQVTFIRRSAQMLMEMVNDLLDSAKIEAGKVALNPSPCSVEDLFLALRGMLRPLAFNPSVRLIFEDATHVRPIVTDEDKLAQILRNFITNSLKFTEQGEIRVCASEVNDDRIILSVTDTGIGIAAKDHQTVFEDFHQVDSPIQRRVRGTGLGLPLCRRLAELLGGEVNLTSEPGVGSTFSVILPQVLPGAEAAAVDVAAVPSSSFELGSAATSPRTILMIDDDETSRYILRSMIQDRGFSICESSNGRDGIEQIRRLRPAVVFLDLQMPEMSGFEVVKLLEKDLEINAVPVIIHSSQELTDSERRRLESRTVAILDKNVKNRGDALAAVTDALRKAGLNASVTPRLPSVKTS